jgi:hypothetical protein
MISVWSIKQKRGAQAPASLIWDQQANQSIDAALAQSPVPALLKGRIKKELRAAAEIHAREAGRSQVTAEDVIAGMLAKIPAAMREKVTAAMQTGPEALKDLEKDLRNQK